MDTHVNELQKQRRQGLVAHLNTLKTILRQGIAVRGHNDEESNIIQFNKDKAMDNPSLLLFFKRKSVYESRVPEGARRTDSFESKTKSCY